MVREFRFIVKVESDAEADQILDRIQQVISQEFHTTVNSGCVEPDPEDMFNEDIESEDMFAEEDVENEDE